VAAAQLGCFAPSDCVAPAPAALTKGSTSIGGCSTYIAAASAKEKGLVDDAPSAGPSLGVPDVDVHLGGCNRVGIAYNVGFCSILEVFGEGGSCDSSFHLSNGSFNLVDKVRVVRNVNDFDERCGGGKADPVLQPCW